MAAPSVEGLAEEWDACPVVREHMRVKRTLFAPEPRKDTPYCNVACGELNFEVLKPIAMRLRLEDGSIGQMKVPDLMKQTFVGKCFFFPGIKFPSVIPSLCFVWMGQLLPWPAPGFWNMVRIKSLYEKMTMPLPARRELKHQAKLAKGFMVLIKKKLNRDQLCRSHVFRKLMALVYNLDQEDWLGQLWWQAFFCLVMEILL